MQDSSLQRKSLLSESFRTYIRDLHGPNGDIDTEDLDLYRKDEAVTAGLHGLRQEAYPRKTHSQQSGG